MHRDKFTSLVADALAGIPGRFRDAMDNVTLPGHEDQKEWGTSVFDGVVATGSITAIGCASASGDSSASKAVHPACSVSGWSAWAPGSLNEAFRSVESYQLLTFGRCGRTEPWILIVANGGPNGTYRVGKWHLMGPAVVPGQGRRRLG